MRKTFKTIYDNDTLNIFTDASMYAGTYMNFSVGCAGVELATSMHRTDVVNNLYPDGYIPNYVVVLNATNNIGELIALRQGILFAIANKFRFKYINIFSDSLIAVKGLTEWSEKWFYKALMKKDETWTFKNTNGKPVTNQEIIKSLICLIYFNDLKVNIYHQRGHCSNNLKLVKKDFVKYNNLVHNHYYLTDQFIYEIAQMNNTVDKRSRSTLKRFITTGYAPYIMNTSLMSGIQYDVSRVNFGYYQYLLGKKTI